jgi:uncharacterized protein (TIGR03066 family)
VHVLRKNLIVPVFLVLALVLSLSVVGCASHNTGSSSDNSRLVGTWAPSSGGGLTWQFTNDGKLIQARPSSVGTSTASWQNVTGTYSVSGDVMTLTLPISGGSGSASTTMTLGWVSNDEFNVTMGGMKLTFARAK